MDVAVQQVVADVGGGSFHALDKDLPFGHVEVVVQERAAVLGLPEELLGDVAPELCATGKVTWSEPNTHLWDPQKVRSHIQHLNAVFEALPRPLSQAAGETPDGRNQLAGKRRLCT